MEKFALFIARVIAWFRCCEEDLHIRKATRQHRCTQIMERAVSQLYALETFRQCFCNRERSGLDCPRYKKAYHAHFQGIKGTLERCLEEIEAFAPEKHNTHDKE